LKISCYGESGLVYLIEGRQTSCYPGSQPCHHCPYATEDIN